ncbi:MAG: ABC transporter ATP-binding protein [Malacoplasma sp.]
MKNKTYLENKEIQNSVNKNLAVEIENIPAISKKASKYEAKIIRKNNKPHKAVLEQPEILPNEIIKLFNVSKSYTNNYINYHILRDINLTIYEKEFVVIYGPSGSGKTTLLSIISALDRPTTGYSHVVNQNTITLNESKLTKLRANYIGYIYQQYGLLDILTVEDNIKITASLQKDKSKKIDLDDLLKYVGLYEHKHKKASQLSGGQSQRVAICRALIKNPKILFGDEPTGAIHIDATKQIMNLFLKINKEYGTTIVIVTHNQNMLQLGDRVIKVQDGKIVENYLNKKRVPVEEISWDDQE